MRRLGALQGYACYYGRGYLRELGQWPLVIVQPAAYATREIDELRGQGARVLAYLSLGEDDPHTPPAPWHVRTAAGRRRRNPHWRSLYVDAGHPAWQAQVLGQTVPALLQAGHFDGLFLDTLDSLSLVPGSRDGAVSLLHRLRSVFPEATLLANRGFDLLASIAADLDGVVFEAFSTYYQGGDYRMWHSPQREQHARLAAWLGELQAAHGLALLALDYAPPDNLELRAYAERRAQAHGMISYVTTWDLQAPPLQAPPPPAPGIA